MKDGVAVPTPWVLSSDDLPYPFPNRRPQKAKVADLERPATSSKPKTVSLFERF
jgi:hypothetical protein